MFGERPKSSGSFSTLFRSRVLRALAYRSRPTELSLTDERKIVSSLPFTGRIESNWPKDGQYVSKAIYLSTGDSSSTDLRSKSIDLVVTKPPFFDNVHYSELADFFYAWQQELSMTRYFRLYQKP